MTGVDGRCANESAVCAAKLQIPPRRQAQGRDDNRVLEVLPQVGKLLDYQQLLCRGCRREFLVLEYPGVAVRYEDGVQSGGQRGIDVGLWAVADL